MGNPRCPGCRALQRRVAELEARLRELEARLSTNANNSSLPPSANPPQAPTPVRKPPSGRKPGGQPGHVACVRARLPAERVHEVVHYVPSQCQRCQAPLSQEPQPGDPAPSWHQVAELPPLAAVITEHQGHTRTCPGCGHVSHAAIPAHVKAHGIGPRLAAVLAYLRGAHKVSMRGVEEIVEAVFDVPLALGTVAHLEQQLSQALATPHAEAVATVRQADVKNVDETGWKQKGKRRWLWVAATQTVAAFLITTRRGFRGLRALLGRVIVGTVCSDRWGAYNQVAVTNRQLCWAHLKRDFTRCAEQTGEAKRVGNGGLKVVRAMFDAWHLFRGGGIDRLALLAQLDPVAERLDSVLRRGQRCAPKKVASLCRNLLAKLPALWKFAVCEGIEPTNNHAERLLRQGVLWRKVAFGSRSAAGCRFVERMLTAVQTLRLQQRPVLSWLIDALTAHRHHLPAPSLLPVG